MTTQQKEDFEKKVREEYWDKYADLKDEGRWEFYIEEILPEELKLAEANPLDADVSRFPAAARQVLILLVGYQIEPLLQAVCAWQPEKVVLVLNAYYAKKEPGKEWGNFVAETILRTLQHRGASPPTIGQLILQNAPALPSAQPANVFRCLRTGLIEWKGTEEHQLTIPALMQQHERGQVVFDITGGKKSMVAGAYLFCAYAGVEVSYVDFDDDAYAPEYGRPYGYACQIGTLENPYQLFRLRDWQRVEELYRSHAFKAAREEVERLLPQMQEGFFTKREMEAAGKLRSALHVYELWERGDHYEANEQAKTLTWFQVPRVIRELGGALPPWPNVALSGGDEAAACNIRDQVIKLAVGPGSDLTDSFYQQVRLVHYAEDELARAARWRQRGDYRSAFLRGYAVYEVLVKARLILQLVRGEFERIEPLPVAALTSLSVSERQTIADLVRRFSDLGKMIEVLSNRTRSLAKNRVKLQANGSAQMMEKFWLDSSGAPPANHPLTEDTLTDLRNQVAHFCLWIPNDLAASCLQCARTNLQDFKTNWVSETTSPEDYEPLRWEELCRQCGLDFLPAAQKKEMA